MTFDEYQQFAITTDLGKDQTRQYAHDPAYVDKILSLVGESGEIAEKYKKIIRDKKGIISEEDKQEITKELGDVLWYIAVIAHYLDVPLDVLAKANVDKLTSRKQRGVLSGKGDNR